MQRRILTVFGLLGAVAGLVALILLVLAKAPAVEVPVVPKPPEQVPAPPDDGLEAVPQEGTVRGLVRDVQTKKPLRGVRVQALAPILEIEEGQELTKWGDLVVKDEVRTDENGEFDIDELPPDFWNLWLEKPGYAWTTLPRAKFVEDRHIIEMGLAAGLTGRVVYPDGEPAAGIRIEYTPQGTHSEVFGRYKLEDYYIETDANGSFTYSDIPYGPFTVEVYPPDHLPAPWTHEPPLAPGEHRDLGTHKLDAGFGMEVHVKWRSTGEPVEGIEVVVRPVNDPMPRTKTGRRQLTNQDGVARFAGLGGHVLDEPKFIVAANVPGVGPVQPDRRGLIEPDQVVTIYLRKEGRLKGKVLRPSGQPLEHFFVQLEPIGHQARQLQVVGENGEFEMFSIPEGRYAMHVRYGNLQDARKEVVIEAGEETDAGTVTLARGNEIYGTVRAAGGGPLEGVVKVALGRLRRTPSGQESWDVVGRAYVRRDGTYSIKGVPAGDYMIQPRAVSAAYHTTKPEKIVVRPNAGGIERNLVLHGHGMVDFKFMDLVDGQVTHVTMPDQVFLVEAATGEEIRWFASGQALRPGRYTLVVVLKDEEGVPQRYTAREVTVQEGEKPDPIEIRLYEIRDGSKARDSTEKAGSGDR